MKIVQIGHKGSYSISPYWAPKYWVLIAHGLGCSLIPRGYNN